jgi:hypothetical protein
MIQNQPPRYMPPASLLIKPCTPLLSWVNLLNRPQTKSDPDASPSYPLASKDFHENRDANERTANTNSLLKEYPPLRYASLLGQKALMSSSGDSECQGRWMTEA